MYFILYIYFAYLLPRAAAEAVCSKAGIARPHRFGLTVLAPKSEEKKEEKKEDDDGIFIESIIFTE